MGEAASHIWKSSDVTEFRLLRGMIAPLLLLPCPSSCWRLAVEELRDPSWPAPVTLILPRHCNKLSRKSGSAFSNTHLCITSGWDSRYCSTSLEDLLLTPSTSSETEFLSPSPSITSSHQQCMAELHQGTVWHTPLWEYPVFTRHYLTSPWSNVAETVVSLETWNPDAFAKFCFAETKYFAASQQDFILLPGA